MSDITTRDAAARVTALRARDEVAESAGIEIIHADPGRAVLRMAIRADMTNGHGIIHGGWVFMLADTAFAYAVQSTHDDGVTIAADITFHSPARSGDVLRADAAVEHRAGATVLVDVVLTDGAGVRVASSRITGRLPRAVL
ncbi:MAG: hotdog fold thioesterase [Mycetocola sp.]